MNTQIVHAAMIKKASQNKQAGWDDIFRAIGKGADNVAAWAKGKVKNAPAAAPVPAPRKLTEREAISTALEKMGLPPEMRTDKRVNAIDHILNTQIANTDFKHNYNYKGLARMLGEKPAVIDNMVNYQKNHIDGLGKWYEYTDRMHKTWPKLPAIKQFLDYKDAYWKLK